MINFPLIPISVKSLKLTERIRNESQLTSNLKQQYAIEIQDKEKLFFLEEMETEHLRKANLYQNICFTNQKKEGMTIQYSD